MQRKIFGEKIVTEKYNERVAAYVVLHDNGMFAIVRTPSGKYFLPGGKIEEGESIEECILRECLEEMGIRVVLRDYYAIGERYFCLEKNNCYSHVTGHFYYADSYEKVGAPLEEGNEVIWMSYEQCMRNLYHPHHKWAIECIKDRLK